MKRLVKKSEKSYKTKDEIESPKQEEEIQEETQVNEQEDVEPFTDMEREDPYLGRYVEITNRRSKYYGYHAMVDDKFYSDRYKIYIEPKRYDDDKGKGYIVNFVGVNVASKWFTVIE